MVDLRTPRDAGPVVDVAAWHRIGLLLSVGIATVGLLASISTHELDGDALGFYAVAVALTVAVWAAIHRSRHRWLLLCWPLTVFLGLCGASFSSPGAATLCASALVLCFLFAGLTQARGMALLPVVPAVPAYVRVYHAMPHDQLLVRLSIALVVWTAVAELPAWLNARLRAAHGDLEGLAETDPLTGLANRRYWDSQLGRMLGSGRAVAVMLADLDHFKRFNDEHGHLEGDQMLIAFARMVEQAAPAADIVARWGGEEFALALHDVDLAAELAERIRRSVPLGQTCSIGLVLHQRGESPTELIGRADEALYRAKAAGRDRVVAA